MNFTYILLCNDGTYYTGWTNNIGKRLKAHNAGKGAKYTKYKLPVTLVYFENFETKQEAMIREYEIKQLKRIHKIDLINDFKNNMQLKKKKSADDVYMLLKKMNIEFEKIDHESILTSDEEVKAFKDIEVLDIKNLLLKSPKGKTYYLLLMPYSKKFEMKVLSKKIGVKRLSFAKEEQLIENLGINSKAVSVFNLINDLDNETVLVVDEEIMAAGKVGFHPNIDTQTVIISVEDFKKILTCFKNTVITLSLN